MSNPIMVFIECLAAAAVVAVSLSSPWWDSKLGVFVVIIAITVMLFAFWTYGLACGIKRMNQARAQAYKLGETARRGFR